MESLDKIYFGAIILRVYLIQKKILSVVCFIGREIDHEWKYT